MEKIFYDQDGVKVTNKLFTTPDGKSYPIKMISSVAVSSWMNFFLLLPAFLFTVGGLSVIGSEIGMMLFAIGVLFIYFSIKYAKWNLKINGNEIGAQSTAMSLSKKDKTNEAKINAIKSAILEAISTSE